MILAALRRLVRGSRLDHVGDQQRIPKAVLSLDDMIDRLLRMVAAGLRKAWCRAVSDTRWGHANLDRSALSAPRAWCRRTPEEEGDEMITPLFIFTVLHADIGTDQDGAGSVRQ